MRIETQAALLAFLKADAALSALVKTFSEALEHWKDVSPKSKPMLTLVATDSEAIGGWGKPNVWVLDYLLYVYVQANANDGGAQKTRDSIIDAVEAAFWKHAPMGRQTLGGKVVDCRISGKVETDQGALGGEAVAWITISVRPTA